MFEAVVLPTPGPSMPPMSESEDSVLLMGCCSGDMAAFEALYRRYHERVYRFIFRMLNNHELAEEAVADTLHAVWKNASSFRGGSAVSSWIFGIAYKTALKTVDRNARHTRNREDVEQMDAVEDSDPANNPHLNASLLADTERVQKAMVKLSPEHQAVMTLTATGHSCEEIATIVDCPKNTVKTRVFHARKQLQRLLGNTAPSNNSE